MSNKLYKSYKYEYTLKMPYECKICSKKIKSKSGLGSHIKNQHKEFTFSTYLKRFENIDLEKQIKNWEEGKETRKQKGKLKSKKYTDTLKGKSPKERLNKQQYEKWRTNMKKVFTLEWFINKYGEEDGRKLYLDRSKKISEKSYFREYNKKNTENYSKISQELFWNIYKNINFKKVYFGELNHEYGCETNQNFDFVVLDIKKIIEFNGDKWHANPLLYEENDVPIPFVKKTAKTIWVEDVIKNNKAIKKGYKILTVWENEYLKNKEDVIKKCLNFLEGKDETRT